MSTMSKASPVTCVKSLLRANPLLLVSLELHDNGIMLKQSWFGIPWLSRQTFIALERIESFDVQRVRWYGQINMSLKNPVWEYQLGWFPLLKLSQFEEQLRAKIVAEAPRRQFKFTRQGLDELAEETKRLAIGSDEQLCAMVDLLLAQGVLHRCSDLHLDPQEDNTIIRYRMDGMFHEVVRLPKNIERQVVARIKVLAKLVTFETRVPQEGRISLRIGERDVDLRVSIYPTLQGEKVAIRVFDAEGGQFSLDALGHNSAIVDQTRQLLSKPSGTILLTGPSGSGKTTTIYAVLKEILKIHGQLTNIVTIEDPIEHRLSGIQQTEIFEPKGLTFLVGLRSMLRQNVDVIMVGEIRDHETAGVAIQAGLTGHLVISTIHAGTSARVLARLVEMGIEPFLIASSINAILAQRLPRKNCPYCLELHEPSDEVLSDLELLVQEGIQFRKSKGCERCQMIGHIGRLPVSEILVVDEEIEDHIQERKSVREIEFIARCNGMQTLWDDGLNRVREGILSAEELVRIVPKPISGVQTPKK